MCNFSIFLFFESVSFFFKYIALFDANLRLCSLSLLQQVKHSVVDCIHHRKSETARCVMWRESCACRRVFHLFWSSALTRLPILWKLRRETACSLSMSEPLLSTILVLSETRLIGNSVGCDRVGSEPRVSSIGVSKTWGNYRSW